MRFVLAIILVGVCAFVMLLTARGIDDIAVLVGYLLGGAVVAPALIAGLFCIPKSGRNNKRFFRVFNVVLLLSILGNSTNLGEVIGTESKTLTDSVGLLEILVPGSFEPESAEDPMLFNLQHRSGFLTILVSYEYAGPNSLDLEHHAQLMGNRFRNNEHFIEQSDMAACSAGKLDCVYQTVSMSFGEKGTVTVHATLRGRDNFYSFIATTNPGLYDGYQEQIFSVLDSIKEL